ncbi:uncharacterized protein LOC110106437 [Dendrobium catenatum]|uniref:uncharacterized protein LOC110106437 n=1 Tax=Dendrobium catenatum TaxID=906689 RepID=UPI0009F738D5|nr:uncharacterized protein LOC110106437 [Dendrobium catenatum]
MGRRQSASCSYSLSQQIKRIWSSRVSSLDGSLRLLRFRGRAFSISIPARVFIQFQSCNAQNAMSTMKMSRKGRVRHIKAFIRLWAFISCHVCGSMVMITSNLSGMSVVREPC